MARWYANQNARPTPVDNALDNPKPVNALDQYGPIALQRAVCQRDTAAVAELVKNKSIELNTVVPRTPLHLLVSEPISEPVFQGATPLSEAVENRNYAIVELLIEAGGGKHRLRPTSHPMYSPSPILNAANYDDQPWLDPNIPNARGMPPLLIAAKNDDIRMIKLLLSIDGINRNACDADRFHPIHYAAFAGNKTMVQALVGGTQSPLADVNAQTSTGETAISFATGREKVGVVEYLLNVSGINPHLTRGSGKMPRQLRIFFSSPVS